jgi:hypothetical protein
VPADSASSRVGRCPPRAGSGLLAVALTAYAWSAHGAKPGVLLMLGLGLGAALSPTRAGLTGIGIMVGAAVAAALGGTWAPHCCPVAGAAP